jgi:uncharacterized peroxidase-related enzyme
MFLSTPASDESVQTLLDAAKAEDGYVMNFVRLWAWRPDVHIAFSEARKLLALKSLLSAREIATLNSTTASCAGDAACSIAWGTKFADLCDASTAAALLRGDDAPALTGRERALRAWASALVEDPNATTREDIEGLRAAGLSDQEIFDATVFVAFRLAFCTVNDALGVRTDRQLAHAAPAAVLGSVSYGRAVDDDSNVLD